MVPVSEARDEHALEVRHDRLERLAVFGGGRGKRRGDLARLDAREHRIPLSVLEVVGDPVDERVAVTSEVRRLHHRAS